MAKKASGKKSQSGVIIIVVIVVVIGMFVFNIDEGDDQTNGGQAAVAEQPAQPFGGDGYILDFGSDFNPGLNAVDELGLSLVIAMDTSGSMADAPQVGNSDPKYLQASRALEQIEGFLETNFADSAANGLILKVGIVGFSDQVSQLFPLTTMDKAGFTKLRAALADPTFLEPGGKTAIGAAMEEGARILAQSGTILKSLIVVSDGENNIEPQPVDVLKAINSNRNSASTVDAPVYTQGTLISFVGFDIDAGGFEDFHTEGARITSAADQAALQTALQQILVADITRLEAAGQ